MTIPADIETFLARVREKSPDGFCKYLGAWVEDASGAAKLLRVFRRGRGVLRGLDASRAG